MMSEQNPDVAKARSTSASTTSAGSGPPAGFGKGVNDYLNQYITIADAKAGAFLAGGLATQAFLISKGLDRTTFGIPGWIAMALLTLSILLCAATLFPRGLTTSDGFIFWEDIRKRSGVQDYFSSLSLLDAIGVEFQYALQNTHVSRILHSKYRLLQWAIVLYLLGAALVPITLAT